MVGHLIPGGGITYLQYADDTLIMVEGLDLDIINLKFLLLFFEGMSSLNINFDKSEVIILGCPEEDTRTIANNLNCWLADLLISYPEMPLFGSTVPVSGFDHLVQTVPITLSPGVVVLPPRIVKWSLPMHACPVSPCI